MSKHFRDKTVCVTGAGGSIGSELCVQLIAAGVKKLILVSISENALYNVQKRLPADRVVPVLGDVADYRAMRDVLEGCRLVIHAAAHKHVPLCEQNPLEAIKNNTIGTYQLARAAIHSEVEQFIFVSTDKAVRPASVMGATKRAAELLLPVMEPKRTKFNVTRFGNVLDSAGSVFPLWREQIAKGGPVTITDPNCTRYFMSISEAVQLILTVASFNYHNPNPHVFDMGKPKRMGDLLDDLAGREFAVDGSMLEKKVIGLRPGEKLHEELSYGGELEPTAHQKVNRVQEQIPHISAKDVLELLAHVNDRDTARAVKKLWEIVA